MSEILQNEKLMIILGLLVLAILVVIILELARFAGRRKRFRTYKRSVVAKIVSETKEAAPDVLTYEERRRFNNLWVRVADYEFEVNGYKYTGSGQVYILNSAKTVKIWYDPQVPSYNCTAYEKGRANGIHMLIGFPIVIAMFALIYWILKMNRGY